MSQDWPAGPPRLAIEEAEVHIWRAELDRPGWPGAGRLPAAERERAKAMRRPGAAARWLAARWALRHVLASYLDEQPAEVELTTGSHGKPQLAWAPERLRFNLSHSGELALVAVSGDCEVGVDVEQVRTDRDAIGLAERALPPEAVAAVREATAEERAAVFHQRWACHEARLKCMGIGLLHARQEPPEPVVAVGPVEVRPGYAAAVAVAVPELPPLRRWTVGPPLPEDG